MADITSQIEILLVALIRDLHTHHSVVIRSEVASAPVAQVLDSSKDVCLLHLCSMSV